MTTGIDPISCIIAVCWWVIPASQALILWTYPDSFMNGYMGSTTRDSNVEHCAENNSVLVQTKPNVDLDGLSRSYEIDVVYLNNRPTA